MSNRTPNHKALHRLPVSEWIARRDESIKRIGALLAQRRMTVSDVAQECGLKRDTAYGHLTHMEGQGLAHRTGKFGAFRREIWAAGKKPPAVASKQRADAEEGEEPCSRTTPARQEGKTRDPMIAALFGPARGVAV